MVIHYLVRHLRSRQVAVANKLDNARGGFPSMVDCATECSSIDGHCSIDSYRETQCCAFDRKYDLFREISDVSAFWIYLSASICK